LGEIPKEVVVLVENVLSGVPFGLEGTTISGVLRGRILAIFGKKVGIVYSPPKSKSIGIYDPRQEM
jgi:hypothetical protein